MDLLLQSAGDPIAAPSKFRDITYHGVLGRSPPQPCQRIGFALEQYKFPDLMEIFEDSSLPKFEDNKTVGGLQVSQQAKAAMINSHMLE